MDPHARGTLVGLGLHHTVADIWRAALEGIVFGMRHHVDTFLECGLTVTNVRAADGGAASDLWLQIAADVLERPVTRIDRHPGSSLGAAFVAAMGTGFLDDWSAHPELCRARPGVHAASRRERGLRPELRELARDLRAPEDALSETRCGPWGR